MFTGSFNKSSASESTSVILFEASCRERERECNCVILSIVFIAVLRPLVVFQDSNRPKGS